ncbi:DNA polymerase IV, partial [Patescibacteria group bacterium]|nr:DNA polymerase IV [Patescibacteria group bacterium]
MLKNLRSWPRAILHVDCDAFFASCEQAVHPEYRGRPVITGKERGIVAAASYEAKALGVKRGTPLWEVRKICPDAIIVPSDYETYSLFSKRLFDIIRRYTPIVEEYSIDEAFAEITGFQRAYNASYEEIALKMKKEIEDSLGLTVSVGLSLSKVLAKVGSKHKKPAGFTPIPGYSIHEYLYRLPIESVWGIGPKTAAFCRANGMRTALDFARRRTPYIKNTFTKPHYEIWRELNGEAVYSVETEQKTDYDTISKMKTFTPPSVDAAFVFAQIAKNLENACIKARRHGLVAKTLIAILKTQDFRAHGLEVRLNRATSYPHELIPVLRALFKRLHRPGAQYRATGVILGKLCSCKSVQMTLFESPLKVEKMMKIYAAIDDLAARMGKHRVYMGTSALAHGIGAAHGSGIDQNASARRDLPLRKLNRLKGETARRHLPLPLL